MNRLRATHVITSLDADGAQRVLVRLLRELRSDAAEMDVVSMRPLTSLAEEVDALGIPVCSLNMRRGAPRLGAIAQLARHIRIRRPSVVVSWLYHANLLCCAAKPFIGPTPLIWNIRNDASLRTCDGPWSALAIRLGARLSRRCAAKIVYCAHSSRASHGELGYPDERACVVPNGFDTQLFRPRPTCKTEVRRELGIESEAPIVGMIGRFHPDKDHATFVAAAARIASTRPDAQFVLCGRDVTLENRELAGWITSAGLTKKFHLLGPRDDVERIASAFDVGVSSSKTEAFSNAIGEMMACGAPCVVTDVGDSAHIVGDGGLSVPPTSPNDLGNACERILSMKPDDRAALGATARRRIQQHFDIDSMTERHYATWIATAHSAQIGSATQKVVLKEKAA